MMPKNIRWFIVVLVVLMLTWLALGHGGPSSVDKFSLVPFNSLVSKADCLLNISTCSNLTSVIKNILFDLLGNIAVFMPFGIVMAYAIEDKANPLRWVTLFGFLLSLVYELIQIGLPGRVVATDDVMLNTLGAYLGAVALLWKSKHK